MGGRGDQGIPWSLLGLSKIPRSKSFTTHNSLFNIREVGRGTKEDQGSLAPIHIVLSQTSSKREINIDNSYWSMLLNPYPFMPNLREAKVYLGSLALIHIVLSHTFSTLVEKKYE